MSIPSDSGVFLYINYQGCWSFGLVIGPAIGGLLAQPAQHYPTVFSESGIFGRCGCVRVSHSCHQEKYMLQTCGLPVEVDGEFLEKVDAVDGY